jgi:hypothetical protein
VANQLVEIADDQGNLVGKTGVESALSYQDLNAMINLWGDDQKLQLEKDKLAVRKYFLEHVNQNTVFFHSLKERLDYLVENEYYEKEILDQYSLEFINVVHSSKAKIISAPISCCTCMETSAVKRCIEPSRCDLKVTPSSSTCANRSFPGAITSLSTVFALSMESTFLKPTPNDSTWNPPLSVNVGSGQFMKVPSPPAESIISVPGCRYR